MNIDDMSSEQLADYAASCAADSEWRQLVNAVVRGGPDRASEALAGEYGIWNTYGGWVHLTDGDMIVTQNGVLLTATAYGHSYRKEIPMKLPAGIWMDA
jgi:hypothetical protein